MPDQEGMREALGQLIAACARGEVAPLLGRAATALGQQLDVEALRDLERLAANHLSYRATLLLDAEGLRGRLATQAVLARLPEGLGELTDEVLGVA